MRLWFLIILATAAVLTILWINGVVPAAEIAGIALKTFASLAVLIIASAAWKAVRGRSNVHDSSDQPVP